MKFIFYQNNNLSASNFKMSTSYQTDLTTNQPERESEMVKIQPLCCVYNIYDHKTKEMKIPR